MKPIKIFKIGSPIFFNKFDDYKIKDIDELAILDKFNFSDKTNIMHVKLPGNKDVLLCRNMSKEEFINDTLNCNTPMRVGKFLVLEFVEYLNFTIEDLKILEPMFYKLDDKHKYEQVIYESYIKNNAFKLTDEQLEEAYKVYKKYRIQ